LGGREFRANELAQKLRSKLDRYSKSTNEARQPAVMLLPDPCAATISTLVVLLCLSTGAFSEELTLSCKFEGSARPGSEREGEINQIFIDTESPAVELRIAQTMGTSNPIYFGFRNRQAKGMTDDRISLYFLGPKMSMAAILTLEEIDKTVTHMLEINDCIVN
jgi:hypothetical protein